MNKLKIGEKTYQYEFSGWDDRNHIGEVEATEDGLMVEGCNIIPWEWILNAMSALRREDNAPST